MTTMTGDPVIDALYKAHSGRVDLVDVPELAYAVVDGHGAPGGPEFTAAVGALFAVSYGAHFAVKQATGTAPRVMPLEALWWFADVDAAASLERFAMGGAALGDVDRTHWQWRAMIVQLPPVDEATVAAAVDTARRKGGSTALDAVRFVRWTEGPSAQLMHVGPYATEAADISLLMSRITEEGLRARGCHHEIYLGDPRRSAPKRLRTIVRHPVEGRSATTAQ